MVVPVALVKQGLTTCNFYIDFLFVEVSREGAKWQSHDCGENSATLSR